jgi:hypothetical protein
MSTTRQSVQLLCGVGVREPHVRGKLVGGGLDPPALQQGEEDYQGDRGQHARDGDGGQDPRQRVAPPVLPDVLEPSPAHDTVIGAGPGRF